MDIVNGIAYGIAGLAIVLLLVGVLVYASATDSIKVGPGTVRKLDGNGGITPQGRYGFDNRQSYPGMPTYREESGV